MRTAKLIEFNEPRSQVWNVVSCDLCGKAVTPHVSGEGKIIEDQGFSTVRVTRGFETDTPDLEKITDFCQACFDGRVRTALLSLGIKIVV